MTSPKTMPRLFFVFITLVILVGIGVANAHRTFASPAAAPRATGYEISWYTIDGGGAQDLSGGSYTLSGTIGQFEAGSQSGGNYTLNGGFWVDVFGNRLYLPLILR